MKIVYDNIIYALQKAGGISVYWSELSKRITQYDVDFYGYESDNIFYKNENIVQSQESFLPIKLARYLSFQKRLPKGTIFHSSYYRIANQKDVANIVTVYDFTYENYRSGLARYVHSWQKKRAINKSDGIVCISHSTKQDLLKFYPNIKEDKIKVIYLGADENFELLKFPKDELKKVFKELIDKKYVLYVGDRSNYKNFDIAVKVAQKLDDFTLVIVGGGALSDNENILLVATLFHHHSKLHHLKL
jgi:mannosyltransferase